MRFLFKYAFLWTCKLSGESSCNKATETWDSIIQKPSRQRDANTEYGKHGKYWHSQAWLELGINLAVAEWLTLCPCISSFKATACKQTHSLVNTLTHRPEHSLIFQGLVLFG